MPNLSMELCGKLAKRVVWYTFAPLDSDLSTGYSYLLFEQPGPGGYEILRHIFSFN